MLKKFARKFKKVSLNSGKKTLLHIFFSKESSCFLKKPCEHLSFSSKNLAEKFRQTAYIFTINVWQREDRKFLSRKKILNENKTQDGPWIFRMHFQQLTEKLVPEGWKFKLNVQTGCFSSKKVRQLHLLCTESFWQLGPVVFFTSCIFPTECWQIIGRITSVLEKSHHNNALHKHTAVLTTVAIKFSYKRWILPINAWSRQPTSNFV